MEISSFHKHLSHEAFLIKCFNKRNFDEVTNFYKENKGYLKMEKPLDIEKDFPFLTDIGVKIIHWYTNLGVS